MPVLLETEEEKEEGVVGHHSAFRLPSWKKRGGTHGVRVDLAERRHGIELVGYTGNTAELCAFVGWRMQEGVSRKRRGWEEKRV